MQFTTTATALKKALLDIKPIIADGAKVLPILAAVTFEVTNSGISVSANNLEHSICIPLSTGFGLSNVLGKACVDHKVLLSIVSKFKDEPVTIETAPDELIISIGSLIYTLSSDNLFDPEDVPPAINSTSRLLVKVEITSVDLIGKLKPLLNAASTDELRPGLMGVFFEVNPKSIFACATNAHIIFVEQIEPNYANDSGSCIIPAKTIKLASTLFAKGSIVSISFNKREITMSANGVIIRSLLIDATYPDVRLVIPALRNEVEVSFELPQLKAAIERALPVTNRTTKAISLSAIKDKSIATIEAKDGDYGTAVSLTMPTTAYEVINEANIYEKRMPPATGESPTVGFNAKLLLTCLKFLGSPNVHLTFSTNTSRAAIVAPTKKAHKQGKRFALLMPIMIHH